MLPENQIGGDPMKNLANLLAVFALMVGLAFSQTVGATIQGTVNDTSGAVLPGVQIVIKNTGTGTTNETVSDEKGSYRLPLLQSGVYALQASLAGFTAFSRRGIRLVVGQTALVDITLQVGGV